MKIKIREDFLIRNEIIVDSESWRDNYSNENVLHKLIEEDRFQDFVSVLNDNKNLNRLLGESLVNESDFNGLTPLLKAIKDNKIKFIKELLKNKAFTKIRDKEGKTPYHYNLLSSNPSVNFESISTNWILTKSNKRKLIIHVCEVFTDEVIKDIRMHLKKHKVSNAKVYYKKIDENGITQSLNFNLVVGDLDSITEYSFEEYLK